MIAEVRSVQLLCENPACGRTFIRPMSQVRRGACHFCSRACRAAAAHERRTCAHCGIVFECTHGRPRVYCTPDCAVAARTLSEEERRKRMYERTCRWRRDNRSYVRKKERNYRAKRRERIREINRNSYHRHRDATLVRWRTRRVHEEEEIAARMEVIEREATATFAPDTEVLGLKRPATMAPSTPETRATHRAWVLAMRAHEREMSGTSGLPKAKAVRRTVSPVSAAMMRRKEALHGGVDRAKGDESAAG